MRRVGLFVVLVLGLMPLLLVLGTSMLITQVGHIIYTGDSWLLLQDILRNLVLGSKFHQSFFRFTICTSFGRASPHATSTPLRIAPGTGQVP